MVEKAVQTLQMDRPRLRRYLTDSQEQPWERRRPQRTGGESSLARRYTAATGKNVEQQGYEARFNTTWSNSSCVMVVTI